MPGLRSRSSVSSYVASAFRRKRVVGIDLPAEAGSHTRRRVMKALIAATVLAFGLAAVTAAQTQRADTVLVNGKIVTVDRQLSVHEAIAIGGDRILAVGTSSDVRKLADRE